MQREIDRLRKELAEKEEENQRLRDSAKHSPCGEVHEFGKLPRKGYYVDTTEEFVATVRTLVRMGISSYKRPEDTEEVPVFLNKSVFSKEETDKIKKQMKIELGIKMTVKGYPGRPSKSDDYRKMQTISW